MSTDRAELTTEEPKAMTSQTVSPAARGVVLHVAVGIELDGRVLSGLRP